MGLFKGIGDSYKSTNAPRRVGSVRDALTILPAQVLEVCLGPTSELYQSTIDIGKIRFRPMGAGYDLARRYENDNSVIAYPLDRSIVRYPLPGEIVMIYIAASDVEKHQEKPAQVAYYSLVVTTNHNTTYNSNPSAVSDEFEIQEDQVLDKQAAELRFDKRINSIDNFKDVTNQVKLFKQLQPFEGDFILQGRFGNTIRFGSTSAVQDRPWSRIGQLSSGAAGDPILVLRVDRENTTSVTDMFTLENADNDDCSIYLCSSQVLPITLACSATMKTWLHYYGIVDAEQSPSSQMVEQGQSANTTQPSLMSKIPDSV